jgi:hypothetical protein
MWTKDIFLMHSILEWIVYAIVVFFLARVHGWRGALLAHYLLTLILLAPLSFGIFSASTSAQNSHLPGGSFPDVRGFILFIRYIFHVGLVNLIFLGISILGILLRSRKNRYLPPSKDKSKAIFRTDPDYRSFHDKDL